MFKAARSALGVLCALAFASGSEAQSNPSWTEPFEPFRIAGNLYYVGTMEDKVRRMKAGGGSPFLDREGYEAFVAAGEQLYLAQLKREQGK